MRNEEVGRQGEERVKRACVNQGGIGPGQGKSVLFSLFLSIYSFFVFYLIQVSKFIFESVFKKHMLN
jgi:hypothetical protein